MPKNNRIFWQFRNSADNDSAELLFYGPISESSWWGDEVTPKQFNDDLAALGEIKNLKLRINSPGGDVFAAAAIYNSLKNHPATVTAYVDGLAASAASVVAMAADNIVMPKTAMMMIHNPSSFAWGDARDLRATADVLDKVRDTIIAAYEDHTGLDRTKLINLMNAETWMTAQDALDQGFADEIDEKIQVDACVRGSLMIVNGLGFGLDKFKTIPAAFAAERKGVSNMGKKIESIIDEAATDVTTDAAEVVDDVQSDQESQDADAVTDATDDVDVTDEVDAEASEDTVDASEVEPEPEVTPASAPTASAEILAERQRIRDIQALAVPGAEKIISNAVESGASVEATALEIMKSGTVRNALTLQARKGEAPNVAPSGVDVENEDSQTKVINMLSQAFKKIRGK